VTLSATNVPGEEALHATVLVELILRLAKAVSLALEHDQFDVSTGSPAAGRMPCSDQPERQDRYRRASPTAGLSSIDRRS
jgi:hypothetical protein